MSYLIIKKEVCHQKKNIVRYFGFKLNKMLQINFNRPELCLVVREEGVECWRATCVTWSDPKTMHGTSSVCQ